MDPLTFRHEYKHYINVFDVYPLVNRLDNIAKLDPHAREKGSYRIHSMYFDNDDDKALFEKICGYNKREKFRLRYYDDRYDVVKLEKKSKINGLCNKQSTAISKEQCQLLINGDYEWLKKEEDPLLLELYTKMVGHGIKPKTISSYQRVPYIYDVGNVRITIDRYMETSLGSKDFFNLERPSVPIMNSNLMILEVKYDAFLPDIIRDMIQIGDRSASAYSKYAMSRMYV